MEKGVVKEKNTIIKVKYYLKVSIKMVKEMGEVKNIIVKEYYYLMENI